LSIVRKLAELHGGAVRAASEGSGSGASFVLSLPLAVLRPGVGAVGDAAANDDRAEDRAQSSASPADAGSPASSGSTRGEQEPTRAASLPASAGVGGVTAGASALAGL